MQQSPCLQAMTGMFQNKGFMEMAEKLGRTIIEVGASLSMIASASQLMIIMPSSPL